MYPKQIFDEKKSGLTQGINSVTCSKSYPPILTVKRFLYDVPECVNTTRKPNAMK